MLAQVQFNSKSPTIKRILKEASELALSPSADYHAHPLETNLFEWHFTLRGPPSPSPYANGLYHGRIVLPPTYPLRPPSFRFLTPSGRFEVNREICLSISGHHEETWQPAWGIRTALVALRSFMDGEAKGQVGGIDAGREFREKMAAQSGTWKCAGCGGRENRVIMKEQEDAAAEKAAKDGESATKEEVIPDELRLGYRDELDEKTSDAVKTSEPAHEPAVRQILSSSPSSPTTATLAATQTTGPSSASGSGASARRPTIRQRPNQASNYWIDMALCGIAAALAIMIIKKLLYMF